MLCKMKKIRRLNKKFIDMIVTYDYNDPNEYVYHDDFLDILELMDNIEIEIRHAVSNGLIRFYLNRN